MCWSTGGHVVKENEHGIDVDGVSGADGTAEAGDGA